MLLNCSFMRWVTAESLAVEASIIVIITVLWVKFQGHHNITLAFPIGRQKLESRTSSETGNDSPYLKQKDYIRVTSDVKNSNWKGTSGVGAQYIRTTFYQFTYNNSFSRKITGSGSLIAALSSPRASSELYGDSTFNPGQEAYHAAKHWIITKKTKK